MWKCPKCQTINDGSSCTACGYAQPPSTQSSLADTPVTTPSPEKEPPKKKKGLFITIICIMLAIIIALATTIVMIVNNSSSSSGNDTDEDIDPTNSTYEPEVLKIGYTLFAPMNYYEDGSKELIGFDAEFGKAVCEKLNLKPEFVEINWASKELELNSKTIDCIWNGMTITPERAENMSISIPYMRNKQVVVTKAENAEKYAASLAGASVVAEEYSAGEMIATTDEFFTDSTYTAVDSMAKALMEVAAGTADVAVVDYLASIGSIGEDGTDFADLVVVETEEFSPEEYGIAFRKGSDMTEKVNTAIKELAADGTLTEIAKKYKLEELLIVE